MFTRLADGARHTVTERTMDMAENEHFKQARQEGQPYTPVVYKNGDTTKQLLARSRSLLFKPQSK